MADLKALADAVIRGDQNTAVEITKAALEEGTAAKSVLKDGLVAAMDEVRTHLKNGEFYIPEALIAGRAMNMVWGILEPELKKAGIEPLAKLLIGTVQGDLHDIGKNLVAMMLKGAGFEVIDLGVDVEPEKFVEQAKTAKAHLVGISALLTTTMPGMEKTIKALKEAGVPVKVMIGGAPVTQDYADRIGADGYAPDAASAVDTAKSLVA